MQEQHTVFATLTWLWDQHVARTEIGPKLAKVLVLRPAFGRSTLWHEIVKLDPAVQLVDRLIRTFPELVTEKDADRRKAYDVASQLLKERMTDIVQFCGRFEVASTRREHESATCIVIRAIYIGGGCLSIH